MTLDETQKTAVSGENTYQKETMKMEFCFSQNTFFLILTKE